MMQDVYIVAIDFDDTLCADGFPDISQGVLVESTVVKMHKKMRENPKTEFILWTSREGKFFQDAVNFCKEHSLPINYFNEQHPSTKNYYARHGDRGMPEGKYRKIYAHEYWDDRAVPIDRGW